MITNNILLVDDDISILSGFKRVLAEQKYSVDTASSEQEAILNLKNKHYNLAVIDIVLGESSGFELVNKIKSTNQDTIIIMITGYPSTDSAMKSLKYGAFEYLEKPCDRKRLLDAVGNALNQKKHRKEINDLQKETRDGSVEELNKFWSNILKDIRTDLNSVISSGNLLSETTLNKKQEGFLNSIQANTVKILDLSSDVLDLLHTENKMLSAKDIQFNLENLSRDIIKHIQYILKDTSTSFSYSLDKNIPLNIKGNPGRLRQVLLNLIDYAVTLLPQDSMQFEVLLENDSYKDCIIRFKIKTSGMASTDIMKNCSSLSFLISKVQAEKMGGYVSCFTKPHKGTKLILSTTLSKIIPAIDEDIRPLSFDRLGNVLFSGIGIRDKIAKVMHSFLAQSGIKHAFYPNKEELIDSLLKQELKGNLKSSPDMKVTDVAGHIFLIGSNTSPDTAETIIESIKKSAPEKAKLKFMYMESARGIGDETNAQSHGFDGFMHTSLLDNKKNFINIIRALLGSNPPKTAIINRYVADEVALKGFKLLIIDDHPLDDKTLQVSLHKLGINTIYVQNFTDAIKFLNLLHHDACFINNNLSDAIKKELIDFIRTQSTNPHMPVISLVENFNAETIKKSFSYDIDDAILRTTPMEKIKDILLHWSLFKKGEVMIEKPESSSRDIKRKSCTITHIGIIAGDILHYLESNTNPLYTDMCKNLQYPEDHILMSIGWLLREGFIHLRNDDKGNREIVLRKQ